MTCHRTSCHSYESQPPGGGRITSFGIRLPHNSLLVCWEGVQEFWRHEVGLAGKSGCEHVTGLSKLSKEEERFATLMVGCSESLSILSLRNKDDRKTYRKAILETVDLPEPLQTRPLSRFKTNSLAHLIFTPTC